MKLVKFVTAEGDVYLNPEYVMEVRGGESGTVIVARTGNYAVKMNPETVLGKLGAYGRGF